jgi:protein-tyrosine phosphatase
MRLVEGLGLQGIDNARDFGGFTGRYGPAKTGRLLRSGHTAHATADDLRRLAGLGLSAVVDLRRPTERARDAARLPGGFAGPVIASDDGDRTEAPHIEFLRQGDLSDAAVERYLDNYYDHAPFDPRHLDLFTRAFAHLGQADGAVLIHCTAGKDRTGILAALVQRALGAAEDDVMDDYLRTNAVSLTPPRVARAEAELRALTGVDASRAMVEGFLGVQPQRLHTAFAAIDRQGGLDAYLARLGLGAPGLERLRARLLA